MPERRPVNYQEAVVSRICNHGVYSDVALNAAGVLFKSILTTADMNAMRLFPGQRVFMSLPKENIHVI
jgi:hypothetical protein